MDLFACAIGEYLAQELECRVQRRGGRERAYHASELPAGEIRFVSDKNARKYIFGNCNVKIALIVAQKYVIFWQVPLDEIGFCDKRFNLRPQLYPLKRVCFLTKCTDFWRGIRAKIRSQPLFEISGFSDIYGGFPEPEDIYARSMRSSLGFGV